MSLKELELQSSYETEGSKEHLLEDFYIPILNEAKKYYRIAGFFSSTALSVASEGIEGLCNHHGHMDLLISPELSESDFETIRAHHELTEKADLFQNFDFDNESDEHLKLLAYLLDEGFLEIKFVIPKHTRNSLFHQKVGIIEDDEGNQLSFSGSINETAQAWLNNIEEFKVFRSWCPGQMEYVSSDLKKFSDYWLGHRKEVADVFELPVAVKKKIISIRPDSPSELSIMERFKMEEKEKHGLSLFPHQKAAVQKWFDNHKSLLMEMATGTGKTRTALGCIYEMLKKREKFITIVATPQNTLSRQWQKDVADLELSFDYELIADGTNTNWKHDLKMLFLKSYLYDNPIVYTTHDTASSKNFIDIVTKYKGTAKLLFICDEVHSVGAAKQREALLSCYDYRIGLTATPERLFDEEGTALIRTFFGDSSFEFSIADALHTINPLTGKPFLNPYNYHPDFIYLTPEESDRCKKLNDRIRVLNAILQQKKKKGKPYGDEQKQLEGLYNKRSEIVKNAAEKLPALENLLDRLGPSDIRDTIIFASDKQLPIYQSLLARKKITHAKITEDISAKKTNKRTGLTEREQIISDFSQHKISVLLGIKCLDEGIDIKSARTAIIMASSSNPREYIQRVGRVIRPAEGKKNSEIYDFIVLDEENQLLLTNEGKRVALISQNALNFSEVYQEFLQKGVDLNEYLEKDQ